MITSADDPAWPGLIQRLRDFADRAGFDITVRDGLAVLADRDAHRMTVTWFDPNTAQVGTGAFIQSLIEYANTGGEAGGLLDFVEAVTRGGAREGVLLSASGETWTATTWTVSGALGSWGYGAADDHAVLWRILPAWTGR